MRLWVRYGMAVCVFVITIIWIVWKISIKNTAVHLNDWGPDAVFYKPQRDQIRFKGFEGHIQFPSDNGGIPAGKDSNWVPYARKKFKHNINIYLSDFFPLNRDIPDSRPKGYVYC